MKKIISLALVFVFVFALAVPTFAADITLSETGIAPNASFSQTGITNDGTDPERPATVVTYNVSGNYIVTVPDAIELEATEIDGVAVSDNMQVVATKVLIPFNHELRVAVDGQFKLIYNVDRGQEDTENEDEVAFKVVTTANNNITSNTVILTVNENGVNTVSGSSGGSVNFTVETIGKPKYNESYTGILTFTTTVFELTNP